MLISKEYGAVTLVVGYKQISTVYLPLFLLNRISPNQIAYGSFQRNLLKPLQLLQLLNRLPNSSYSSMHTEIIIVNNASQRKSIEAIHNIKVNILIILIKALLIEIHYLGHLTSLMISTK